MFLLKKKESIFPLFSSLFLTQHKHLTFSDHKPYSILISCLSTSSDHRPKGEPSARRAARSGHAARRPHSSRTHRRLPPRRSRLALGGARCGTDVCSTLPLPHRHRRRAVAAPRGVARPCHRNSFGTATRVVLLRAALRDRRVPPRTADALAAPPCAQHGAPQRVVHVRCGDARACGGAGVFVLLLLAGALLRGTCARTLPPRRSDHRAPHGRGRRGGVLPIAGTTGTQGCICARCRGVLPWREVCVCK